MAIYVTRNGASRVVTRTQKGDPGISGVLPMIDVLDDATLLVKTAHRIMDTDLAILSLPWATAAIGDPIEVFGYGLGGFKIPVPAGKVIHLLGFSNSTLTDGTDYIASEHQFSFVRLRCIAANEFVAEMYDCSTK